MNHDLEHRRLDGHFTTRNRRLVGHAARFNVPANIGGAFTETIAPGAFRNSLTNGSDILALTNHNVASLLGRTKSGTLRLREDEIGLSFEVDLPDTQTGRDILALAERGDISEMSFGFRVNERGQTWNRDRTQRTLTNVDLVEISVVTVAAYSGTSVSARSDQPARQSALARRATALKLRGQA